MHLQKEVCKTFCSWLNIHYEVGALLQDAVNKQLQLIQQPWIYTRGDYLVVATCLQESCRLEIHGKSTQGSYKPNETHFGWGCRYNFEDNLSMFNNVKFHETNPSLCSSHIW